MIILLFSEGITCRRKNKNHPVIYNEQTCHIHDIHDVFSLLLQMLLSDHEAPFGNLVFVSYNCSQLLDYQRLAVGWLLWHHSLVWAPSLGQLGLVQFTSHSSGGGKKLRWQWFGVGEVFWIKTSVFYIFTLQSQYFWTISGARKVHLWNWLECLECVKAVGGCHILYVTYTS